SSVMADLRTMSTAATALEPRHVDDDLLQLSGGYSHDGGAALPPVDLDMTPLPSAAAPGAPPPEPSMQAAGDASVASTTIDDAAAEKCPTCGAPLPASRAEDAPSTPSASTRGGRVRALLRRPAVRTFAPWVVAAASMLLAVIAWFRGGKHALP